ncbi:MAG: hypothetical protein ACXVHK_29110 [Solirubrobacteraceae bacterium]
MSNDENTVQASSRQVFGSALNLVGRLGLVTLIGALGTLAITRLLSTPPSNHTSALCDKQSHKLTVQNFTKQT